MSKTLHQMNNGEWKLQEFKKTKAIYQKSCVDKTDYVPNLSIEKSIVGGGFQGLYDSDTEYGLKSDISSMRRTGLDITEIDESIKTVKKLSKENEEKAIKKLQIDQMEKRIQEQIQKTELNSE